MQHKKNSIAWAAMLELTLLMAGFPATSLYSGKKYVISWIIKTLFVVLVPGYVLEINICTMQHYCSPQDGLAKKYAAGISNMYWNLTIYVPELVH
jgi:hypothetical protein